MITHTYTTIEVDTQGWPADVPLVIQLKNPDGVQAEVSVAAGFRLVVDADGVRSEPLEAARP